MDTRNRNAHHGFTIVELLIVVVLIAILATITIVAYNGLQKRAQTSAVSTALNQAGKKVKLYQVDNNTYPTTLASAGIADDEVTYQYTGTASTFCITGTQGNTSLYLSDTVTKPTEGGCPGHGQGGVAAITNLVTNPSVELNTAGISGYFAAPISRDVSRSVSGVASALVATNSSTSRQGGIWLISPTATAGIVYSCTISLSGTAGVAVQVSGRAETSAGAYVGESLSEKTITLSNTWQRVQFTFTTPTNTGRSYLQFRLSAAATGINIWADAVICTESSTSYNYADGSSPNWVWTGAAHASTSTGPAL